MEALDVRIVELPAMRVVATHGYGKEPEALAIERMERFAAARGLAPGSDDHPLFGFNNPNPSPGSENYGYELWMKVGPDVEPEGDTAVKKIPAASYAVTRFTGLSRIGEVWKAFGAWFDDSPYASHTPPQVPQCWLESPQNFGESDVEKCIFDLYLAVTP
jgi:DNA gyrase inhibitor GyrI